MQIIDVRLSTDANEVIGYKFDKSSDLIYHKDARIKFKSENSDQVSTICYDDIESITNLFKAIKAAAGITEKIIV